MIDPSFWDDDTLGVLSAEERLLFVACFSNADDDGRLRGSAEALRKIAFGFRDDINTADVDRWINNLCLCIRGLVRYEVDGRIYLAFRNWRKYQYIQKPTDSIIPAIPSNYHTPTIPLPDANDTTTPELEEGISRKETTKGADAPEGVVVGTVKGKIIKRYEQAVKRVLTTRDTQTLDAWIDDYSADEVLFAVTECLKEPRDKPAGYISAVLKNRRTEAQKDVPSDTPAVRERPPESIWKYMTAEQREPYETNA